MDMEQQQLVPVSARWRSGPMTRTDASTRGFLGYLTRLFPAVPAHAEVPLFPAGDV